MAIRILPLLVVGILSGCAGIKLPSNLYVNKCSTMVSAEASRPASCMTLAEYRTARKQARHSAADEGGKVEEIQPAGSRSRIGIP